MCKKFSCSQCGNYDVPNDKCLKTGDKGIAWRAHRTCCGIDEWHIPKKFGVSLTVEKWGEIIDKHIVLQNPFMESNLIFVVKDINKFRKNDFVFQPLPYEPEKKRYGTHWMPHISTYMHAERIPVKTTAKEKIRKIPHIIKLALTEGWKPGKLKKYLLYKTLVIPSKLNNVSMSGASLVHLACT